MEERPCPDTNTGAFAMPDFRLPGDLSKLTRAELAQLKADAQAEVNAILERDTKEQPFTMTEAARIRELTTAGKTLTERDAELAAAETADAAEIDAAMAEARDVFASANTVPDGGGGDDVPDGGGDTPAVPETPEALTGELVTASGRNKAVTGTVLKKPTLNASLRNASLREAAAKSGLAVATHAAPELEISAFADIPGFAMNQRFGSNTAVADAFIARARALPVSRNAPNYVGVASIKNSFDTVLNERTPAADVEAAIKRMTNPGDLWGDDGITTAGGGWCAPPVNRYAFFDMTCEDGGIDLPTMGIERGGINFPTSPSLADVFTGEFTNGTNPWLWTETDDILTVTGSVNKPCVRVPCPAFTPVRLECYGICLTAGNLTDNAYPEATQHQISLLNSALFHASNTRYIQQMVALSTTIVTGGAGGAGVISPVLYMVELAASDYRTRFGMCKTEVLEVVLPHWIIAAMRADATKRTGVDLINVTDNQIADWFETRHIRAQFVSDWQVRATGLPGFTTSGTGFNSWPTTVDFMIYAAGTFIRGNGMTLNLGVVRDSTLNAENDHTALWMEECHLIARFGPQSRQYRVNICADGTTGANDLVLCTP